MNPQAVPTAAAITVALAWLPVLLRFFRSWRQRNNPISFAICTLILFALYVPVYAAATFEQQPWPVIAILTIDVLACLTFYVTFHLSDRKFPNTRKNG